MTQTSEIAGRELDALVAEKVMGWERVTRHLGPSADSFGDPIAGVPHNRTRVPLYSTDIAAAWQVVERAKYVSLTRIVSIRGSAHDGEWSCILRFSRYNDDADSGDAHETTAPLAICRAALAAFTT